MITRIAPTPSGYLHLGNALNFLLVSQLATELGGQVALRLDDMDATRYRREYAEDVFRVLDWLEIEWDIGPRDVEDFERTFSQRLRTEHYRAELPRLIAAGAFACSCSRAELRSAAVVRCGSGCREQGLSLVADETALRLPTESGDVVVWRRDGLPAYHLVSVIEDRDMGITHVLRGEDLCAATEVQREIAMHLSAASVLSVQFLHHPLITDDYGRKLSKSQSANGVPLAATVENREHLRELAREMAPPGNAR